MSKVKASCNAYNGMTHNNDSSEKMFSEMTKAVAEEENDLAVVDSLSHLTLLHCNNNSNKTNDSTESTTTTSPLNGSKRNTEQKADPDELINLLDELSVSFKQAPFMPYCL